MNLMTSSRIEDQNFINSNFFSFLNYKTIKKNGKKKKKTKLNRD